MFVKVVERTKDGSLFSLAACETSVSIKKTRYKKTSWFSSVGAPVEINIKVAL